MRNRIFGFKSITNLIYASLCLLPMFAIFGRLIYTQSNANAKDSYSDEYIYKEFNINNYSEITNDIQYYLTYKDDMPSNTPTGYFPLTYISLTAQDMNISQENYDSINKWLFSYSLKRIYFYNNDNNLVKFINYDNTIHFYFIGQLPTNILTFAYITRIVLAQNKLDNAFEYSLSTFVEDNNFDIDFFGWFTDLFLDQNNQHNLVYLNFANWYMNYCLLVSSGYLLFLALIWFTQFVRRILDRSMNHDFGGF